MKKILLFIIVAFTTVLFTTSCQKEDTTQSFTARIENDNSDVKTVLDGTHINWQYGTDEVKIYDENNNSSTFIAQQHSNSNPTCAKLVNTSNTLAETGGYKAIYPADISQNSNTIKLPQVQTSSDGSLTKYPMYAETNTKSLQFKNICSVLKISLKKDQGSTFGNVSKIVVLTDHYINGTFTISYSTCNNEQEKNQQEEPTPIIEANTNYHDHTMITTLQLPTNGIDITNPHDFYIYLPAGTYNYLRINVYDVNGDIFTDYYRNTSTTSSGIALERSKFHALTFNNLSAVPLSLGGEFSIGGPNSNRKIRFSRGNVLYNGTNSYYYFASNQYTFRASSSAIYSTYRFQWGSSETISTATDWSTQNIKNGNRDEFGWITPGSDWIRRIMNSADGDPAGRNQDYRYAIIKIKYGTGTNDYQTGMVLFPDFFIWPSEIITITTNKLNKASGVNNWAGEYNLNEWQILENAGCVFLPITNGYHYDNGYPEQSNYGYYWTSTPNSYNDGICIRFSQSTISANYASPKRYCMSVRLVKEI